MEVQYQPDINDYYAAQKYICRSVARGSFWRFVPKVVGSIFGFCFVLGAIAVGKFYDKYNFLNFYELNWGLGIIVLGFVILVFGLSSYNRAIKPRMFNPEGLYRSPHKISLGDDNILVTVKNNKYTYSYGDILRVDDDQYYVYVFMDGGAALYIPTRSFETVEVKKAFINELSNKINR